jgi:hypothetical protein
VAQVWPALLCVALCASQAVTAEEAVFTPYANDEIAMPDVLSMVQMKTGVMAAASEAAPAGGKNDVLVNGGFYVGGKVHVAQNILTDKEVKAMGAIRGDASIIAKTGFQTPGTVVAKGEIKSSRSVDSAGPITAQGTLSTMGQLNVALTTNAAGLIKADKGMLASGIVRGKENIVSDKSIIATNLLSSTGGVYTKGAIKTDSRLIAKSDIHTEAMLTAKGGVVTPGNVYAEGTVKASKDVRAERFVYAGGVSVEAKGVTSKGLILSKGDVKAENLMLGVKGVRSNVDVVADNNLEAKKETKTQTLTVSKDTKVLGNLDVNGAATFGSATIKGKLYVGKRAIGDIVQSMESEMSKMRAELAEAKESLRRMTEMMTAMKAR